ncbi:MAG TPA: M20/M25/M40 family metallo-hydrolase [Opitutales bacterium]|jgi:glutamate carboxypeptidase|nr:M20/M25/M40 family metallo-hydrolase [Opitutales bacterium]
MKPDSTAIHAALVHDLPAALAHLCAWVGVNSHTCNRDGVNLLGRATATAFAPLGFSAEFVPCEDRHYGDHLFLCRPGRTRTVLLCVSHLDTVFSPEEEVRNHFQWREAEGRIYGPGTVDIKGGTALLWLQLSALRAAAPKLFEHFTWVVACNAAEEVLSDDFARAALTRFGANARAALVYESGPWHKNEFTLVTARKGRAEFRVATLGRGAHAGSCHADGVNAIAELARLVPQIEALTNPAHECTANVGLIRGGEALNRVPHAAEVLGELRAYDPAVLAAAENAILMLAGHGHIVAVADGYRCRVLADITGRTSAWPENAATQRLFDIYARAAKKLAAIVTTERRGGLSDGNLLALHLPTLDGLGPFGGNAHTSEWNDDPAARKRPEFLDPASLLPKAMLNLMTVQELAEEI